MSFTRPVQTNNYNIFDPKGLTRPSTGLSHLNEHRFSHNFHGLMNPLCSCVLEMENTSHYLFNYHHFSHLPVVPTNSVKSICDNFESIPDNIKEDLLLYDDSPFDENKYKVILKATICKK